MVKPVSIYIDGSELITWTEMTLSRTKTDLTGSLSISIFMGNVPDKPVMVDAAHGRGIAVYIGQHLAFLGLIDRRIGTGAKHGKAGTTTNDGTHGSSATDGSTGRSVTIGPNEYTVQLKCRGKTKVLIDSSHQHPTTNMLKPKTKQVLEKLIEPWGIELDWNATDIELDKVRFRDGARVIDEISRLCRENCYFMWETRDGKLYVTDAVGRTEGEPLVLGSNILQFSAEQGEDTSKQKLKIKGQRSKKGIRGEAAVLTNTIKEVRDSWMQTDIPTTVQHYGDATPDALERRGRFEANKRSADAKQVTIEVFHVQSTNGEPWDVGQVHYVEVPPEGVFDELECTELTYSVKNDKELKTTMTLAPLPAKSATGGSGKVTSNLPAVQSDAKSGGVSRRAAAGVTFAPKQYPQPWSGPILEITAIGASPVAIASSIFTGSPIPALKPPLKLGN